MKERNTPVIAAGAAFLLLAGTAASGQVTVYNNFGPGHDGWDYNWGLGWTIAGEDVPNQFGVEQAMQFSPTESGHLSDVWVAMWNVPLDPGPDVVIVRLARNPNNAPPTPDDVMEQWTLTEFGSWSQWNPPIHLEGDGSSYLEAGSSYWLWASAGHPQTWCGWCLNPDPGLTCPHTLRREGEDWLPIANETASAFRVDVMPPDECPADFDGDGTVGIRDLLSLLAAWGDSGVPQDLDHDGVVGIRDLLALLAAWGPC
ncbi:MAG: hypothetical protein ACYS0G_13990 [Planctomycetota bacterium]|jgi:hypothetical protein